MSRYELSILTRGLRVLNRPFIYVEWALGSSYNTRLQVVDKL